MTLEFFTTNDRVRIGEAIAVRVAVFVDEQGVPLDEEVDEHDGARDPTAVHVLARDEHGAVLATGRYYRDRDGTARIGRMAVVPRARGLGIGRRILDALMDDARHRGYTRAELNAQEHALAFYENAGFTSDPHANIECGIVHRFMVRDPL